MISIVVKEVLARIYAEPSLWKPRASYLDWDGMELDGIILYQKGNTKILSIIGLQIAGKTLPLSWREKYLLEKAALWWYSKVKLSNYTMKGQGYAA